MENNKNNQGDDFYQKAISLYRRKNYDYAIELFGQSLNDNPNFPDCQRYLWDSIRQKNTLNKKSLFSLIYKKTKIILLTLKFLILNLGKKDAQMLKLIHDIIMIDPNNISAFFKLSNFYIQTKQKDLAITALEEIISINKNNLQALKILADIYYTKKLYEKAKLIAIKILNITPHYLPAENILNDISALNTIEKGFDEIKPAT